MNIRPLESLTKEELIELIRHERDHIEQPLTMAPEGWRFVPVEPTPEMILCGWHIGLSPKEAYVEMLAAAPQPDHIPDAGKMIDPVVKDSLTVEPTDTEMQERK